MPPPRITKLFFVVVLLILPLRAYADFQGKIYALDPKTDSITVGTQQKKRPQSLRLHTYRVRLDSTIILNGIEARFEDLSVGMPAKVISADFPIATQVIAYGLPARPAIPQSVGHAPVALVPPAPPMGPPRAATVAPAKPAVSPKPTPAQSFPPPTSSLADSRWQLPDGKVIGLQANGQVYRSWGGKKGWWKVVDDRTIELSIWNHPDPEKATINPESTWMQWVTTTTNASRVSPAPTPLPAAPAPAPPAAAVATPASPAVAAITPLAAPVAAATPVAAVTPVAAATPKPAPTPVKSFPPPTSTLADSKWQFTDGKIIGLRSDGKVDKSWGSKKGWWKVLDDHTLELSISKDSLGEKITLNPEGTWMQWLTQITTANRISAAPTPLPVTSGLIDSSWQLPDGKVITFRSDGTVDRSYADKKGHWKIDDDHTIELAIWKRTEMDKATINPEGTSMQWLTETTTATRVSK